MAGPLASIERFLERLLERPAARLFQARPEPVHLQRQLERAMEAERRFGAERTYVPSSYRVLLHPVDMTSFEGYRDSLSADLADALHAHARRRGYLLAARPHVELESSPRVAAGEIVVEVEPADRASSQPEPARQQEAPRQPAPAATAAQAPPPDTPATAAPEAVPESRTSVYSAPKVEVPKAALVVRVPNQPVARVPVRAGAMRLGRALDNDLVLADDRVSRHHGQLSVRFGTLVYADLGSTNGSYLNGSAVTEIALGPGDVLQLGGSTLAIEQGD